MKLTFPSFDQKERQYLDECLDSGWVTQGPFTQRFEQEFAKIQGVPHALATTSCTAALHLACLALRLGPGDEVIVPSFTWITSAHCVLYTGAKVVFAEVDPLTFNIDPERIEELITPKTKAIVAVHLFGLAAEMDKILAIAKAHKIAVIEDAACAIGTTFGGTPIGAMGDIGCFSFHPRKAVTTGEGGMVTTKSPELADLVASLRNHGAASMASRLDEPAGPWTMNAFTECGMNLRLSDIQAAVGVAQLEKLERLLHDRRKCAALYDDALGQLPGVVIPATSGDKSGHAYQSYVITLAGLGREKRNAVMTHMAGADIATRPGTHCVPNTEYYQKQFGYSAEQFLIATRLEDETITLPLFPGMTEGDISFVADRLKLTL